MVTGAWLVIAGVLVGCGSSGPSRPARPPRPAINLEDRGEPIPVAALLRVARAELKAISTALRLYQLDVGVLPSTAQGLKALLRNPGEAGWKGPYLTALPRDPWGRAYRYRCEGKTFTVSSVGPDGTAGNADDISTN
jgi:type II secretion system protein G